MNKEDFLKYHMDFTDQMYSITKAKNSDYTGNTDDAFANFTAVERNGIATTAQGFMTRMQDKMCRITSFIQKGTLLVKDEKVEDTLMDLANYCILFSAYLRSKHDDTRETTILEEPTFGAARWDSNPEDNLHT